MPITLVEAFHAWHDFYILIGTGAGALVGAMFVVASIGSSLLTEASAPQIRAFLTPTVIHLSTVLLGCALTTVPSLEWPAASVGFGIGGGAGLVYSATIGLHIARRPVEFSDRIWYGLVPTLGYGVILAAALLMVPRSPRSLDALALGVVVLLVASIRNAWDLIVFFVSRSNNPG